MERNIGTEKGNKTQGHTHKHKHTEKDTGQRHKGNLIHGDLN